MLLKFETEAEWLAQKAKDVTSTEIAALFGLDPYKSRLKLWHEKKGNVELDDISDSPFAKWGRRLQIPVAKGICEDEGWVGHDLSLMYARSPNIRLGASFDVLAFMRAGFSKMLEVKVSDQFREEDGWLADEAPVQYEFQIQTQLHLAMPEEPSLKGGIIGTLGRRQSVKLYHRDYDAALGLMIENEVADFWESVESNNPPAPDYSMDADLLERVRGPLRAGDVINLSDNPRARDLVTAYGILEEQADELKAKLKPYTEGMKNVKTELLHMIGRNERAIIGDFQIGAREQAVEDKVIYGSSFRRFDLKRRKK